MTGISSPMTTTLPAADSILAMLVDAVCVVDERGHFLYNNPAWESLLGYSPDELRGRQFIDFVHPADRDRTLNAVDRIIAGQPVTRFHNRYLHRSGRIVTLEWSARWSDDHRARFAVGRAILVPSG